MDLTILKDYGINYEKGIARCMGDKDLYEQILGLFLEDDCMNRAKAAFEKKDYPALFKCMHELKGSSGNAELTEIFEAVCPLVELLRHEGASEEEIALQFHRAEGGYDRAREGIVLARR